MAAIESLEQTFQKAVRFYENGNLKKALKCLNDIQRRQPDIPDVLHLLGLVTLRLERPGDAAKYLETATRLMPKSGGLWGLLGSALRKAGRAEDALKAFGKALAINSNAADLHYNMGNTLRDLGRLEDAADSYRNAVATEPGFTDAWVNLGGVLKDQSHLEDAAGALREAVRLNPEDADAQMTLGNTLEALGDEEGALAHQELAVRASPELAQAHYNLGNALRQAGREEDAATSYRNALKIDPGRAEVYNNLGETLLDLGDIDAAIENYGHALACNPELAGAHNNLAKALGKKGDLEASVVGYRRALGIDPGHFGARTNLGNALGKLGKWDEALACQYFAVENNPDNADAHHNLALTLLLMGRMQEGWAEYEWRWTSENGANRRTFPQASWQGEDLLGKTIMVWSEQGVGDEVLFAGMVPGLLDAGANVVLESDARLVPVFGRSFPSVTCVPQTSPPVPRLLEDTIDFQCAMGSLGRWLRTATDIRTDAYLVAGPDRRNALRKAYKTGGETRLVGITWSSKNRKIGEGKSLPLSDLIPLAGIPGVTLVDLQYGDTRAQRDAFREETGVEILHDDDIDQMADLDAFCDQVAAMDVVVTVSNTTAHFAGALGVPTWVMVHPSPLPCWLLERDDSPWYPDVTLFRQTPGGEWADVVERVANKLSAY